MERNPKRAWRRKQIKRKWYKRLRDLYFYSGYSHNDFHGVKKFKSWKELKSLDWANIYKTTGTPCSCRLCTGERYSRLHFSQETKRIIKEELFD